MALYLDEVEVMVRDFVFRIRTLGINLNNSRMKSELSADGTVLWA